MSSTRLVQQQRLALSQQLSQQQLALSALIGLGADELRERVENELMSNEALEQRSDEALEGDASTPEAEEPADEFGAAPIDRYARAEADDYRTADDVPEYLHERLAGSETGGSHLWQPAAQASPLDDLQQQADLCRPELTPQERQVMRLLIGSLDDDGLLRKSLDDLSDEMAVYHNVYATPAQLERVLRVLQGFEPRGIGARSLQECMELQLSAEQRVERRVLSECFDLLSQGRWADIARRLQLTPEQADRARHTLLHLNPRPGRSLEPAEGDTSPTVRPDFRVRHDGQGELAVELARQDEEPRLRVSPSFVALAQDRERLSPQARRDYLYARQKVEGARGFIELLRRRRETLLCVMRTIVSEQQAFFRDDDETLLRPLTLSHVARRAGVDVSTVSRAVGTKYVETDFGQYPLRMFFPLGWQTEQGEELSQQQVKRALQALLSSEDKRAPLSDEALSAALRAQGLDVARRTVAKYREQMGVPVARLRRG